MKVTGMAEYIEREALMKNFCGYDLTKCVKYGNKDANQQHDSYSTMMMYEIASEIEDAPAADVAPVRHGEWIVCGDGNNVPWMCSHCGKTITRKFKMMYGKYCPNCGAKMDKEDSQCDT